MKKTILSLALAILAVNCCQVQGAFIPRLETGSVAELPEDAHPDKGKLTLWADFLGARGGSAPVYLINRTEKYIDAHSLFEINADYLIELASIMRETRGADEVWRRCDKSDYRSHYYSWGQCGTGTVTSTGIPPEGFIKIYKRINVEKGPQQAPRIGHFRIYAEPGSQFNLISNEGTMWIDPKEEDECRYDGMAMAWGPFEDVAAVAAGKVKADKELQSHAIKELQRFADNKRLFGTAKEVVKQTKTLQPAKPGERSLYEDALDLLIKIRGKSASVDEVRIFLEKEIKDVNNPYRLYAQKCVEENLKGDAK